MICPVGLELVQLVDVIVMIVSVLLVFLFAFKQLINRLHCDIIETAESVNVFTKLYDRYIKRITIE